MAATVWKVARSVVGTAARVVGRAGVIATGDASAGAPMAASTDGAGASVYVDESSTPATTAASSAVGAPLTSAFARPRVYVAVNVPLLSWCTTEINSPADAYTARMIVRRDGRVVLHTPIIEQGSGMLTTFRLLTAEEFGLLKAD